MQRNTIDIVENVKLIFYPYGSTEVTFVDNSFTIFLQNYEVYFILHQHAIMGAKYLLMNSLLIATSLNIFTLNNAIDVQI